MSDEYNSGNTSPDRLAQADLAARRHKSKMQRPRDGWRLCTILKRSQLWMRKDGPRTELVGGPPLSRCWFYTVMDGEVVINQGAGGSLAAAMQAAEEAEDDRNFWANQAATLRGLSLN